MYKVGQDNKLHKCFTTSKAQIVPKELHMVGGHFVAYITTKKILDVDYWWPILLKTIHEFAEVVIVVKKLKD
jgi:hypothetical protein